MNDFIRVKNGGLKDTVRAVKHSEIKKLLIFLMFMFIFSGLDAEIVHVPVYYENEKAQGVNVKAIGFYADKEKYVWAFEFTDFKASEMISSFLGIYVNSDADINTGRFKGSAGVDWQLVVDLLAKKLSVTLWNDDKKKISLPIYPDDYVFEKYGNLLYLAVKKSVFEKYPFKEKFTVKLTFSRKNAKSGDTEYSDYAIAVDCENLPGKTFSPAMNFTFFGENMEMRDISRNGQTLLETSEFVIWDSFGERFPADAKPVLKKMENAGIYLKAAKGEAETFLFYLTPLQNSPRKISIEASALVSGAERIERNCINISPLAYIKSIRGDEFPDVVMRKSNEFKLENGRNNIFIMRLDIPGEAKAGDYAGKIIFTVPDGKKYELPLNLHVYDFALPEKSSFKTAFSIKSVPITRFFKQNEDAVVQREFLREVCADNRFSSRFVLPSPQMSFKDGKLKMDWHAFDLGLDKAFNRYKFNVFQMTPQLGSHDAFLAFRNELGQNARIDSPEFHSLWSQYIQQLSNHMKEKGVFNQMLFVIWDEPYTVWKEIRSAAEIIRKTDPEMKIAIWICNYEPQIAEFIDVWGISSPRVINVIRKNHPDGTKKIWLYNLMSSHRSPIADVRCSYWFAYKYEIDGYLDSEINDWGKYEEGSDPLRINPCPQHIWLYPDTKGGRPYSSLRVEMTRDGLEDYEYLSLLHTLIGTVAASPQAVNYKTELETAREALKKVDMISPELKEDGSVEHKTSSLQVLQPIRDEIAVSIEKLSKIAKDKGLLSGGKTH